MRIIKTKDELHDLTRELGRSDGPGGVLVPTMGALHEGHAALIRAGAAIARERRLQPGCIVSIFVNPTQFNDPADLARYPRTLEADLSLSEAAGASIVFAPSIDTMYPPHPAPPPTPTPTPPPLPAVATTPGLEDAHRPGHFAGVCQVVKRLFELLGPDAALFGEKDWQQLQVIAAMTREAFLPIEIIPFPTIRDPDGLALSSRNRFLSADQRTAALAIPRALLAAEHIRDPAAAQATMSRIIRDAGLTPEYTVIRDAATLGPVIPGKPARALIAARAGSVRLIDNAAWPHPRGTPASSGKL